MGVVRPSEVGLAATSGQHGGRAEGKRGREVEVRARPRLPLTPPPHLSLLTAPLSPPTRTFGNRWPNPVHPPQTPPLWRRLPFPVLLL
jgi:hypothetical protein